MRGHTRTPTSSLAFDAVRRGESGIDTPLAILPASIRSRLKSISARPAIGCVLIGSAMTLPSVSALAQGQAEVPAAALEEVMVTGSRIQRSGMNTPTPVTAVTQDELEAYTPGTLMDQLDLLPQFLGNATIDDTSNFFGGGYLGAGGQSNLNLRGVGGNRTLVLVNGRRIVPSNRNSTVDISLFPQALVQRTEVVTGGASAAYGSDAVTGVTNFILNTQFTGFDAHLQGGISDLSDAENWRASVAAGFPVGDRAHVTVGVDAYWSAEITSYEGRDWYKSWGDMNFGTAARPQRVRYENTITRNETFGGIIRYGPLAGTHFVADGSAEPFEAGDVLDASALAGLASVSPENPHGIIQGTQVGGSGDQFDRESMRRAELERYSLFANVDYELTDRITGSLQLIGGYSYVDNQKVGYVLSGTWPITIYAENPFLPEDIRTRMQEEGIESFRLDKRVSPRDPLHNGRAPLTTDVISLTGALEGTFENDWNWKFYYQYGESNRDVDIYGFRVDRMFRGIDSVRHPETGEIVCASTLIQPDDGCVPVNIFGIGNTSPEARAWLHDSMWTDANITQHATEFMVDGQLFDGWAGPILLAAGVNWRRDAIDQLSGDAIDSPIPQNIGEGPVTAFDENGNLLYRGLPPVYEGSAPVIDRVGAASFSGSVSVSEAFAEIVLPLVSGRRLVQRLDSTFATRYTDYEVSGGVQAWKGGLDWQVTDDVRFRLTRSRDIRAGNLSELFDTTILRAFMDDPWHPEEPTYIVRQITGGNPAVKPEEADTLTYGLVYQPSWLSGLAMSVDYYDIKIASAISSIGAQNIVDYCYEENIFCDQITYAPNGLIEAVDNTTINVGEARTRGMDIELSYRRQVSFFGGNESLSVRALGSRLFESSITPFDSPRVERVGSGAFQEWNVNLSASYNVGPVSVSWTTRWANSAQRNLSWVEGIDIADNKIPSHSLSNLRVNYDLDRSAQSISIYGAITNVFDRTPADLDGLEGLYNDIGRAYTVGFRYRH